MPRAIWLALITFTTACGARGGLDVGTPGSAGARDGGAVEVGERCATLRPLGEPMVVFDARAEGAHVVARSGGFDVASFVIEEPTPSYHVRRITIEGERAVLGREAVLGPEARSVGSLAGRGARLALCYGGRDLEGPTRFVRTDDVEYARTVRSTIGMEGGDHCVALVPLSDGWFVGWQSRAGGAPWAVSEVDDDGRRIGALVPLDAPPLAATAIDAGAAYAHRLPSDPLAVRVALRAEGGGEREVHVVPPARIEAFAMIASPFAPGALEVAWSDRAGSVVLARVFPERASAIEEVHALGPFPEILSAPAMTVMHDRPLIAIAACDRPIGSGAIVLERRDGTGSATVLRLARPGCPIRPAFAALRDHAALAWEEGERTMIAVLRCER